jgi:hypothetical protein
MQNMADQPHNQPEIVSAQKLCELLYRVFMFGAVECARILGKPRPKSE